MDKVEVKTRDTNGELVHISVILEKVMKDLEIKYEQNIKNQNKEKNKK